MKKVLATLLILMGLLFGCQSKQVQQFKLNQKAYFETRGANVLVYNSWYNGLFSDEKRSGIEIIQHDVRTATNGDVRLNPTPEQWDAVPTFIEKKADSVNGVIEAFLYYPEYDFKYSVIVSPKGNGVNISVNLEKTIPLELQGKAGFNLEFLPSSYFEKSYLMDGKPGVFPLYPSSDMEITKDGVVEPLPFAKGKKIILSPEDPKTKVKITSEDGELSLYDGRNKAQNGWFVVRSLIPVNRTGKAIEWNLEVNSMKDYIRKPVIGHSQLGYHPKQEKKAIIELDINDNSTTEAKLLRINEDGSEEVILMKKLEHWGNYLRYKQDIFDFSEIKDIGAYVIETGGVRTKVFRIDDTIFNTAWQPTLDVYFPVQMDHMFVNEAYRVWHGRSHMDDALQAPVNHVHFDLYAMGSKTDTPYKGGEHIPGLNYGGWYDAGDYDIRTQTQCFVVQNLVNSWERFRVDRDQTLIDQRTGYVDIHVPDGKPDLLQQIEHGALGLLAQHRAVGHAIHGIVASHLDQYTHLGDGVTKTDNLIYSPAIDSFQTDGFRSRLFDDRWAFTTRSTPLNYLSVSALAAASRALKGYHDELANECLETAIKVWNEEHSKEPDLFHHGNTTGGDLLDEELKAAVQLLLSTKSEQYAKRLEDMWPMVEKRFMQHASRITYVLEDLNEEFRNNFKRKVIDYKQKVDSFQLQNPYGVPITTGGWAGSGAVTGFGITTYDLYKVYPEIIDPKYTFKALEYLFGNHPGSNISFVSGIGTKSKKVAYGNNRADFSFIAGGLVPGVLIIPPDFPENKEDWPFLWGENEYVVSGASSYLYLVLAANEVMNEIE